MPDAAALDPPPPADAPAGGGGRPPAERQIEALGELVGIGLKLARAIERQVDGPPPAADLNAAAIAFARVARAVRQTVMLQNRLLEERDAVAARAGEVRSRLARIVRRAVKDEHGETEQAERLAGEAAEGLEQERYGDLLTRPIREIVADICKDLGLSPDWDGLFDDIAAAEAFARGEAAAAPPEEDDGPAELYWIGKDGRPELVETIPARRRWPPYDPSKDPALRNDSS